MNHSRPQWDCPCGRRNDSKFGYCPACGKSCTKGTLAPPTSAEPINSADWQRLCETADKSNPNHWAFVHLACAINHLGAALLMAGINPNEHQTEMTIPNEA